MELLSHDPTEPLSSVMVQDPPTVDREPDDLNLSVTVRERLLKKLKRARKTEQPPVEQASAAPQAIAVPEGLGEPQRKLKGLRDIPRLTRFDESEDSLVGTSQANKRWTKLRGQVKECVNKSQDEENYQFFAGMFAVAEDNKQKPAQSAVEAEDPSNLLESSALLEANGSVEEDDGGVNTNGRLFDYLLPPQTSMYDDNDQSGNDALLHYVSTKAADNRLSSDTPLRYREDEGFYVGDRPNVKYSNLNAVESRILSRNSVEVHFTT